MGLLAWTVCCAPLLILLHLLTHSTGSPPKVQCESSCLPVLGGAVTLTCEFLSKMDVLQVTWQMDKANQPQTIATYSKKYGMKISSSNDKFRSDNVQDADRSSIIISDLREEDQACYVCIFNAFPHGAYKGRYCLDFPEPSTVQPAPTFPAPLPVKAEARIQEIPKSNDVTAEHPQEVACSSSSKETFDIILKPSETIQEHLANDTDGKPIYERKFAYKNLNNKPSCVFRLQKNRNVRKRALPEEGADDVVFVNCTVTGKAAKILWINEGNPVNVMDHETRGPDPVTVTSARGYLRSSLREEEQIECVIIRKDSRKNLCGAGDSFSIRIAILMAAVIVILALCIWMWICSLKKFKETHTPRKPRSNESMNNTPRKPCLNESIISTTPVYPDTLHETPDGAISKRPSQTPTQGSSLINRNLPKSCEKKRNPKIARPLFREENI